ncbi:Monocopper oxidase-like protein SKU5 [Glycine soja]
MRGPTKPLTGSPRTETSVVNGTYKGFMEIMLQNNDTKMHTYHMSGYAFVVVRMDFGDWSKNSRGTYNQWDGIARTTTTGYSIFNIGGDISTDVENPFFYIVHKYNTDVEGLISTSVSYGEVSRSFAIRWKDELEPT